LQFAVAPLLAAAYRSDMNAAVNFVEYENRVISASYRNLMVGAKIVLVDKTSGEQLPEPVTTIASPVPSGSLRIPVPASVKPGDYFLKALDGHGQPAAQSVVFQVA
jgi:hypothetical protein